MLTTMPAVLSTMVSSPPAVAMLAVSASIAAVELSSSLNPLGASTTTPAQAVQDLLLLPAMGALLAGVASIYRRFHHHAVGAAAARARTEVAFSVVCAAGGLLQLLLLLHGDATRARALGPAAVLALPAAAAVTFFLGIALIFAHVHGGGVAAGNGPIQAPGVSMLAKLTLGAAAGIVGLMALALYA